jgi:hypothetical protein
MAERYAPACPHCLGRYGHSDTCPHRRETYRVGRSLGTTIYRDGEAQPCAWVPDDPDLAARIVAALNAPRRPTMPEREAAYEPPYTIAVTVYDRWGEGRLPQAKYHVSLPDDVLWTNDPRVVFAALMPVLSAPKEVRDA